MAATVKTSTINRATPLAHPDISHYCNDLESWPCSWMGLEKDLPPGKGLVACFRPFIEQLALSNLSQKTIRMHVDNLWGLGGEIIPDLNDTPSLRKVPVPRLLLKTIAGWRTTAIPLQLGGTTTLLRLHLPQTPAVPRSITAW
jgi:hypothetical protein